jgi:hypothetical protein
LTEAEKQRVTMYLKRPSRKAAAASSSEAQNIMVADPV